MWQDGKIPQQEHKNQMEREWIRKEKIARDLK